MWGFSIKTAIFIQPVKAMPGIFCLLGVDIEVVSNSKDDTPISTQNADETRKQVAFISREIAFLIENTFTI